MGPVLIRFLSYHRPHFCPIPNEDGIYCLQNNLRDKQSPFIIPDDHMNTVFGKDIALYDNEDGIKILMSTRNDKMTTYDVIRNRYSSFKSDQIKLYFFQAMISLNIYYINDLDEKSKNALQDETIIKSLFSEHQLISKAYKLIKSSCERINLKIL